jgi:uncharacterized protein YtpQ (UPF0354 family)
MAVNIIVPLLMLHDALLDRAADDPRAPVHDQFGADLVITYSPGPPFGEHLISRHDLEAMGLTHRALRRRAADHLAVMSERAQLHGSPPSQIVSFDGLESSLLVADEFWTDLAAKTPGEIVAAAPARDVLIVTTSASSAGIAKAQRCVDRVFFAGGRDLLTQDLLIWRDPGWEVFTPAAHEFTSWHTLAS